MKATAFLCRGAKGYGWYSQFKAAGSAGFRKNVPPTPFNWENSSVTRPRAYFQLNAGPDSLGTIVIELASDVVPKTVENFKLLCTGSTATGKSYKGSKFHLVNKGKFILGGDVETSEGSHSHSAYKDRYIKDENFIIPHSEKGIIRYVSSPNIVCAF